MDNLETREKHFNDADTNAAARKQDHIELTFDAQVKENQIDERFYYEPLLAAHPKETISKTHFLDKEMRSPIWISSMTGGTQWAKKINHNLAKVCGEYGLGMGLGSCRALLSGDAAFADFNVRPLLGNQPLYANLGIAQVEKLIAQNQIDKINLLVDKLEADGLIVHINPLQEWLQPEGDTFEHSPLETLSRLLDKIQFPIIVKEVGQGFGKESLKALFGLPLAAIDFAASGGTNFALLELIRNQEKISDTFLPLTKVGHSANEMVLLCNQIKLECEQNNTPIACKEVIISGGVKTFLDGYYYTEKINFNAIYGQASGFLKHARGDYETLQAYTEAQINGFRIAKQFLRLK